MEILPAVAPVAIEKVVLYIVDVARKKVNECMRQRKWESLFVETGELCIKDAEKTKAMCGDMSALFSRDNMIALSQSVKDKNGFRLKAVLQKELVKLMGQYGIPHYKAVEYISHFIQIIIADIEVNDPEKFNQFYLEKWKDDSIRDLSAAKRCAIELKQAAEELQKHQVDVYTAAELESMLRTQTENPNIALDFFETDDDVFRKNFKYKLDEECVYISGKCREESIYSILYELRKLMLSTPAFVVKSYEGWEKLRLAYKGHTDIRKKILIPWFWHEEIIAVSGHTNIFVCDEDNPCVGKQTLKMRKRTKQTVRKKLEEAGADKTRAYQLVEDTHGLYIPLKKKIFKGTYGKKPNWVVAHTSLTLPALLCGKWTEDDGDKLVLEQLSGRTYDDFTEELQPYIEGEEPFIVKYNLNGNVCCQLASLENAWDYLGGKLDVGGKF